MILSLLEVVAPVDRIKPYVQEVLGPLSVLDNETAWRQAVLVLSDDQVDPIALEIAESLDDTVWWHDGSIGDHERFQFGGCEKGGVDRDGGVHDNGGRIEVPEETRARMEGHGMAHGGYARPCWW